MKRILYTLCGADTNCRFSPHAFKIVMALHHKGLDFEERPTPFTAIPQIENGFSATVPVLNDNGVLVRDSFDIALHLEDQYPDRPSLFGGEAGRALTRSIEGMAQFGLRSALIRILVKDIHDKLAPVDQAYFRASREKRLGETLEAVHAARAPEIDAFAGKLEPLRHVLAVQPWFGGVQPMFADYVLGGAFAWAEVTGTVPVLASDDIVAAWFERLLALHDGAGGRWIGR